MEDQSPVGVLVCRAGAAGLTLAINLARRRMSFRLIDKLAGPFVGSRGKGIQLRTQEVFKDHRCLVRHGISRLPQAVGGAIANERFKASPFGYFHLDIAEVRTEQGKAHLFVAVGQTSKSAFAQPREWAARRAAANLLHALVEAVQHRIHTMLTDNGMQFTDTLPSDEAPEPEAAVDAVCAARSEPRLYRGHAFDHACERHGVEHGLTKP